MNNYNDVRNNYQKWYLDLQNPIEFEKRRKEFLAYHQNLGITRVQIEPTQRCNFSCHMCPIDELDPSKAKKDMSLTEFQNVISSLPKSVNTICLSGLGEPFLNKEYIQMVAYAKKKGYITEVYNNGSLFNKEILKYVDYIYFSVDAFTKELIEELRSGVKYDALFDAIKQCVDYRDTHNQKLEVVINFTISKQNYKEVPLVFDFCQAFKVNALQIQATANNYSNGSTKYQDFSTFIEENTFTNWEYILEYYKKEYDFSLTIWYPRKLKGFCNWNLSSAYVTKDLNIISCCHKVTHPMIFGNLKDNNLEEILKMGKVLKFKKDHLENNDLPLCNNCPF